MYQSMEYSQWCFVPLVVFFPNFGYVFFPHFQLLCEWTECNQGGFLEPWSAGYLCRSHIWSPGGALSCSIIPMFSFQGVSRESRIKHHFLPAINRDAQTLSSADAVNWKKKKKISNTKNKWAPTVCHAANMVPGASHTYSILIYWCSNYSGM